MVAMRSLMTRRSKRGSGKGSMHRLNMQSHMQGRHLFWNFSIQLCKKRQAGRCLRSPRNTTVMQQALQLCQILLSVVSGFLTPHRRSRLHQDLRVTRQGVTPSESALCKFQRNPPNPHRNDSKVPTRHLRAGGKRSNNITQQSSMGPTEQIYIQHDSMSQEYRYTIQRSESPRKRYSVQLRTRCKWG